MEPLIELIEASRAGDRQAQERLVLEVQDQVYRHCRRLLVNEDDALDATQDVLIAMLRGLGDLREPRAFWSWLNRITVNLCCKRLRSCREVPLPEVEAVLDTFENFDDQTIPERALDNEENRRLIVDLVKALPEAQRMCVLCYYYDEMSVREIAAAMGTSENTVKSRLHYARRSIREGVERYAAQGFKLYAVSPLPFLRYFLQREAGGALSPVAAGAIQQALLAAGAAGTAAGAAGSVGTAVTAAATKAAGSAAVRRGLLALAGLALAGAVGGGALSRSEPPPAKAPAAQELVLPAAPEEPEPLALPDARQSPREEADGASSRAPAVLRSPVVDLSAPESPRPEPQAPRQDREEDDSAPHPDSGPAPEPIPDSGPEPGPLPDSSPEPEPGPTPEPLPDSEPEPDPTPDPLPQPQPAPAPEPELPPAASELYSPNPDFGVYLGENSDGVHEFSLEILPDRQNQPYPLLAGHFYGRLEISDGARVGYAAQYIYGKAPGTCDVRYYVSPSADGPFQLKAIAHVTVLPPAPITANYDWGGYQKTDSGGVFHFARTAAPGDAIFDGPLARGSFFSTAESSDPAVVTVRSSGQLYAAGPGSAEIRYYTRWTAEDPWSLAAVVQMTVQADPPQPVPPAAVKEVSVGYGCVASFADAWGEPLPEAMEYSSSRPSVARVSSEGVFTAFAPGVAVLTAWDPGDPSRQYALTVQVRDAFHWDCRLPDITLAAGETLEQSLAPYRLENAVLTGADWVSGDPLTATVTKQSGDRCEIVGIAPGVTEVEVRLFFLVNTPEGETAMRDTLSFQVRVEEPAPPEDGVTVIRQEAADFGYCSGYGYSGEFSSMWTQCDLPETLVYTSSDSTVVYADSASGRFTTLSGGSAVLTARDPDDPARQYELAIEVRDRFDWSYQFKDVSICLETGYETNNFTCAVSGASIQSARFTSSDPSVVEIHFSDSRMCSLRGLRPGTVDLNCEVTFRVSTWSGDVTLRDTIACKATAAYSEGTEAVELTEFGNRSGYGYSAAFSSHYPGLPEGKLSYGSSNYNVVSIESDGTFTTRAPGRAVLTASVPGDPQRKYALAVEVQDCFDWELKLADLTLEQGDAVSHGFNASELPPGVSITWAVWSAEDALTLSAARRAGDPLVCDITALRPGITYVTASLDIQAGGWSFREKARFRVTVLAPEPEAGDDGDVGDHMPGGIETVAPKDAEAAGSAAGAAAPGTPGEAR